MKDVNQMTVVELRDEVLRLRRELLDEYVRHIRAMQEQALRHGKEMDDFHRAHERQPLEPKNSCLGLAR
jgi:hypothetical protein